MDNIIHVKNLSKEYKSFRLENLTFTLPTGCVMGMIGPNGAGKTTTIKLMMSMIRRSSGEIKIFGLNYPEDEKVIKNGIGYVGEEQFFYQNKNALWTGKFVSHFFREWDPELFGGYLEDFRIPVKKKIKHLSRGNKVKLSLAVALSHGAKLLILDEPTSGLDPVIRREVLDLILKLKHDEGLSVFFSSHITEDVMRIADFIMYIVEGRIVITEEKDELLSRWKRVHFRKNSIDGKLVEEMLSVEKLKFESIGITGNFPEISGQLEEGISRGDIVVENMGLDDILLSLVKEL